MILDLFKLDGKVAVVTGANTGLGQGMAVALAQAGAKVLGVARRSCEDTKNKIEADGGVFAEVIADLSDMASIDVVMKAAIDTYGRVDILVNNAGIIKRQDAINAVMQNYCYESDRMTALQELPVITDEKIRNEAIINYSVAVLAEVAERAKQEDAPIYEGDKEVDQWVRLSDVEKAINKYLN